MRAVRTFPFIAWPLSILLHAGVLAALVQLPHNLARSRPNSVVSFSVASRPGSQPQPAPRAQAPTPDPTHSPKSTTQRVFAATAAKPARPSAAPTPVDLTGVTLTGGDGAGWSSMTGNGQTMDAPIRPSLAAATAATSEPVKPTTFRTASVPSAPEVVPIRDLAAKPMPPALDAQLLHNYPPDARRQGIAGKAVVVARVDADGLVRHTAVRSETRMGFGAACERTLRGSRWSPPRDRGGRPVATQISYTCDFRVDG